jgi:hypothetical protein
MSTAPLSKTEELWSVRNTISEYRNKLEEWDRDSGKPKIISKLQTTRE